MSFERIGRPSQKFVNLLKAVLNPLPMSNQLKFNIKSVSRKLIDYSEYKLCSLSSTLPETVKFKNREALEEFDFTLPRFASKSGISAFIRAKNEEDKIYACLLSIIDVFDEIIFIDNQSDDATVEVVRKFKSERDFIDKIKLISYPFKLARCGTEHQETPENSVQNIAYYYNYTLSKCTYKYVVKWDADMIFKPDRVDSFKSFVKNINESKGNNLWDLYGQNLYRDEKGNFWLSCEEIYHEPRIFPLSYFNIYAKGRYFELLKSPSLNFRFNFLKWALKGEPLLKRRCFSGVAYYELKFFGKNEFSHWMSSEVLHTLRKRREMEAFSKIQSGEILNHKDYTPINNKEMPFHEFLVVRDSAI